MELKKLPVKRYLSIYKIPSQLIFPSTLSSSAIPLCSGGEYTSHLQSCTGLDYSGLYTGGLTLNFFMLYIMRLTHLPAHEVVWNPAAFSLATLAVVLEQIIY